MISLISVKERKPPINTRVLVLVSFEGKSIMAVGSYGNETCLHGEYVLYQGFPPKTVHCWRLLEECCSDIFGVNNDGSPASFPRPKKPFSISVTHWAKIDWEDPTT
jgi:hypothetical protein